MEFALMVNQILLLVILIFGCDMSFSSHSTNKTHNIYVLGKGFVQGINGTTIYAEKITNIILQHQIKNLFLVYIIMTIILIYLSMEDKNENINHQLLIKIKIYYV